MTVAPRNYCRPKRKEQQRFVHPDSHAVLVATFSLDLARQISGAGGDKMACSGVPCMFRTCDSLKLCIALNFHSGTVVTRVSAKYVKLRK